MSEKEKAKDLVAYRAFLENLAKTKSSKRFGNAGIPYASTLMSVLFEHTEREVSMYCEGFKPDLITSEPYWEALNNYLTDGNRTIRILVESDEYKNQRPIQLLKQLCVNNTNACRDRIQLKKITPEAKKNLMDNFLGDGYNFAFFDDNMYRVEYSPKEYKAFGSFNEPRVVNHLRSIYEKAWRSSMDILEDIELKETQNA